jgi:hypothetical protein
LEELVAFRLARPSEIRDAFDRADDPAQASLLWNPFMVCDLERAGYSEREALARIALYEVATADAATLTDASDTAAIDRARVAPSAVPSLERKPPTRAELLEWLADPDADPRLDYYGEALADEGEARIDIALPRESGKGDAKFESGK